MKRKRRKTSIFKLLLRLLVLFFLCKLVNSKSSRLNYLTSILVSKPWNNLAKTIGDCSSNKNPQGDIYNITCDYTLVHHIYWRGETIIFCLTAWFFFTLLLHSGLYLFLFENILPFKKHQCWSSLNQCCFICFLFFLILQTLISVLHLWSFNHLNSYWYIRYIIALFISFLNPLCITMCKMEESL